MVPSTRRSVQQKAVAAVARVLETFDEPTAIIGGIAVIASGFARLTSDIDCSIFAQRDEAARILSVFEKSGFTRRAPDTVAQAQLSSLVMVTHDATSIDVDIGLAQSPWEHQALTATVRGKYGKVNIDVPRVDDLLIYKLVASRAKDLQDAEELLIIHPEVDTAYVERMLALFDEVTETNRVDEWRRIVRLMPRS